jgi:ATP-dependent RNA helicase DeaD
VRCNDADEGGKADKPSSPRASRESRNSRESKEPRKKAAKEQRTYKKEDWMQFLTPNNNNKKLKGEIPDFSEEGWAIRKPRKKK